METTKPETPREGGKPLPPPLTERDRGMAVLLLAVGYLFCRLGGRSYPAMNLLYELLLAGGTVWYFKGRMGFFSWFCLLLGLGFGLSHVLTDNGAVQFFARFCAYVLWAVAVFWAAGNGEEGKKGEMLLPEGWKAAVLMPFARLGAFFSAAFSGGRRRPMKTALLVLAGLAVAVIPVAAVAALLSYDEAFSALLKKIFSQDPLDALALRLMALIWGTVLAVLGMSLVRGCREHRLSGLFTREQVAQWEQKSRFLPQAMGLAILLPLLGMYGLFFFSQLPLYTAAFTGVLPEGYTYAAYAREGFFQLCAVCLVNGLMYVGLSRFTKGGRWLMRGLLLLLCLCSLVLSATAFSKMVLYIGAYGLTPKRVYASWAMVLLTGGFLLALVGAFSSRRRGLRGMLILFGLLFLGLCLINVDGRIAAYNVAAYEQGRLSQVDMDAMEELGAAAAPAVLRLAEDETYGEQARYFLARHGERDAFKALCHGVPGWRAARICQDYWREDVTVSVTLETEGVYSLACYYWQGEQEAVCAGEVSRADGEPFSLGEEVFFPLPTGEELIAGEEQGSLKVTFRVNGEDPEGEDVGNTYVYYHYDRLVPGAQIRLTLHGDGHGDYYSLWEKTLR